MRRSPRLGLPLWDAEDALRRIDFNRIGEAEEKLLSNATAEAYGLGAAATPDQVLGVLNRFQRGLGNEYVWKRYLSGLFPLLGGIDTGISILMAGHLGLYTIKYASSLTAATGEMVNPVTVTFSNGNNENAIYNVIGKYWAYATSSQQPSNTPAYYTDAGTAITVTWVSGYGNRYDIPSHAVRIITKDYDVSYVNSPNSNAYPVQDGYTYEAYGPLGSTGHVQQIEYVGTGVYGQPTVLNCAFRPKMVTVTKISGNRLQGLSFHNDSWWESFIWTYGQKHITQLRDDQYPERLNAALSGNQLSWWSNRNAAHQLNENGAIYSALIFG